MIGESMVSRSRFELEWETRAQSVHAARGQRKKHAHGITVRVQRNKLFLGPLGFPRRLIARKWGRLFGVDIIVADAMYSILAVSSLWYPK